MIYREQEQIELSQCILGANPNALAKAYAAGCLSEEEIDQFSALCARAETQQRNPGQHPSAPAAVASSRRRKLAILARIQTQL